MSYNTFELDELGMLEMEGNFYIAGKNSMVNLRKILDRLEIHYILDRVSFHSTDSSLALLKAIHDTGVWKVEKDGSVHLDNRFGHGARFRYDRLVIPCVSIPQRAPSNCPVNHKKMGWEDLQWKLF